MRHSNFHDSAKIQALADLLSNLSPLAVALSGGVDSSLLLHEAHQVLGDRVVAVTGVSASLSRSELREARQVADHIGARLIEVETEELESEEYRANRGDRCFYCKNELYGMISRDPRLREHHIADGTNADDVAGDRPGMRAAAAIGVVSPLREAEFGKSDIRSLARFRGLSNWDRPARPCLASRIAVGTQVDARKLADVEALEAVLSRHGFSGYRARIVDRRVLVEVGLDEVARLDAGG